MAATNKKQKILGQATLETIANKRRGGEYNFRGIGFQLSYAAYRVLYEFTKGDTQTSIRLEGLEDMDVRGVTGSEYIQLKFSTSPFDANKFIETNALQNFLEVYLKEPTARFRVIHNNTIKKGHLLNLANQNLTDDDLNYFRSKLSDIPSELFEIKPFLTSITFECLQFHELQSECCKLLLEKFEVDNNAKEQYLKAFYFHLFEWSKNRQIINSNSLWELIESVTDAYSHIPSNPALTNNWIGNVTFKIAGGENLEDYFEGKAAKPVHIASGLPVRREKWEKTITEQLEKSDAVIIRASSGQGKSTIAWQVCQSFFMNGFTIYQLHTCSNWNEAAAISKFIITRLAIGQTPIVIIDGLNKQMEAWGTLLEQLAEYPVKFLVTAREEDWHRYQIEEYKINMQFVTISMNQIEAVEIYKELKKRGKINSAITNWQQAFEQVAEQELLIEYTYLLTQGQMLENRLKSQIEVLRKEIDAAAKLEILRLISIADCMGISLETKKVLHHINSTVGVTGDREAILLQLEREYCLKFEESYIEGLHPIRSKHLLEILHHFISIGDTLISVLTVLNEKDIYDFSINLLEFIPSQAHDETIRQLAFIVSEKKFIEIVSFFDGLMHAEPHRYWLENKAVFDEVHQRGSISLFSVDTIPFTDFNFMESFSKTLPADFSENYNALIKLKNDLAPYSIKKSSLYQFATHLKYYLNTKKEPQELKGLEFLTKWFIFLKIEVSLQIDITEAKLKEVLKQMSFDEVKERYAFFRLTNPEFYKKTIQGLKSDLIGWLKKETDTLSIVEDGDGVRLEYIMSGEMPVNKQSVSRIETLYHFLPFYDFYSSELVFLPYPNETFHQASRDNANKRLTAQTLYHSFDVHLNQIWSNTIEAQYRPKSIFQWQSDFTELRQTGLDFAKGFIRLLEAHLESNALKNETASNVTMSAMKKFGSLNAVFSKMQRSIKYSATERFSKEQSIISSWLFSLSNFINQCATIFEKATDEAKGRQHTATVNLKNLSFDLIEMQSAFSTIIGSTYVYFLTQELDAEEQKYYTRLLKTVLFFNTNPTVNAGVLVKNEITTWWDKKETDKLAQLSSFLLEFKSNYGYKIHTPAGFDKSALYDNVTIGIEGMDFLQEQSLSDLSIGFQNIVDIDVVFITILLVKDAQVYAGIRFNVDYFHWVKNKISNPEEGLENPPQPLPIKLTTLTIKNLPNLNLAEKVIPPIPGDFLQFVFDLWKFSEYSKRINGQGEFEGIWLKDKQETFLKGLNEQLSALEHSNHIHHNAKEFAQKVLAQPNFVEQHEFVEVLNGSLPESWVF